MLEIEKKRAEIIDEKMNVNINLETGETSLKIGETDNEFTFAAQNRAVNQFMQDQLSSGTRSGPFRPFEADGKGGGQPDINEIAHRMLNMSTFNIKAANLND